MYNIHVHVYTPVILPICEISVRHIPLLCVQWKNSWWWTEELSETRRVLFQKNKFEKLVHLVGFVIRKYSGTPLNRTLAIRTSNYPDRLGLAGKFVENSTGCPTRYRTRQFFNNFTTNGDIAHYRDTLQTHSSSFLTKRTYSCSNFVAISLLLLRVINPLNAELNPICHLLALLGAHHILHVSRVRVKVMMGFGSEWDTLYKTNLLWNYRLSDQVQYSVVASRASNQAW